jgi:hypothetical protein
MLAATLANELLNLDPTIVEAEAVVTLANAYATFATTATAGVVPITPAGVTLGKTAMAPLLIGMSEDGLGSAKITQGVQGFWAAVALGGTTSFAGAVAILAPAHAGLQAALDAAFSANTASVATKEAAVTLLATAFYSQAIIGGVVTFPASVTFPIL